MNLRIRSGLERRLKRAVETKAGVRLGERCLMKCH